MSTRSLWLRRMSDGCRRTVGRRKGDIPVDSTRPERHWATEVALPLMAGMLLEGKHFSLSNAGPATFAPAAGDTLHNFPSFS